MINYIEKGIGLHTYLQAQGLGIVDVNGVWVSLNPDHTAINAAISAYPLSACVSEIKLQIDVYASALRNKITAGVSPAEMASWSIKRAEAEAFGVSGNPASAPVLGKEALARGATLTSIVSRVNASAAMLSDLEAAVAGNAGRHKDALTALTTFADVLRYNWSTGWPV